LTLQVPAVAYRHHPEIITLLAIHKVHLEFR
jgi:hypothetical protein